MPTEIRMIQQAYKFALDPTPAQARMLASHAGAKRYVYNWTHAAILTAAQARQAQKDAGEEPSVQIPGQFDLGPVFTRFKNTAIGCRACRALLAPNLSSQIAAVRMECGHVADYPAPAPQTGEYAWCSRCGHMKPVISGVSAWVTARDGSAACGEPGVSHDPTSVSCSRCWDILEDGGDGRWLDRNGHAGCPEAKTPGDPHEPHSEFLAWTGDVFTGSMQAAMRDADTAWKRFLGGKARHPRFKE
jgi:hypothetical protein